MKLSLSTTEVSVSVGPLWLRLITESVPVADSIRKRYAGFSSQGAPSRPDFTLKLVLGPPRRARAADYLLRAESQRERVLLLSGAVSAELDFARSRGVLRIALDPRFGPGVHVENVLRRVAQRLLIDQHAFLIHAAAMVAPGSGEAALFPAPSGYGKTTFARHLESRGHHLVSDDLILVDCQLKKPRVRLAPFFGTIPPRLDHRGPWTLSTIDFLRRFPTGRSESLPTEEAAAELLANIPFCEDLEGRRHEHLLELAVHIAREVPAHRLRANLTPSCPAS